MSNRSKYLEICVVSRHSIYMYMYKARVSMMKMVETNNKMKYLTTVSTVQYMPD